MKKTFLIALFVSMVFGSILCACRPAEEADCGKLPYPVHVAANDLYEEFREPGNDARPFVRWWWNGTRITKEEVLRELDVMDSSGVGGVEINSIAFPHGIWDTLGYKQVEWLSDEWLDIVKAAATDARDRGMYADLIVGSGWPFGAETLSRDQQIKMLALETMEFTGPQRVTLKYADIFRAATPRIGFEYDDKLEEMYEIRMIPYEMKKFTQGQKVDFDSGADEVTLDIPEGRYSVYFVVKLTGYMRVIYGSLGAKGPVLDHFDKAAVTEYINRMSEKLKTAFGENIGDYIRAFFVDSLELEGSNWCNDFNSEFRRRRGYSVEPYLPFVLRKVGSMGNEISDRYGAAFTGDALEEISRVRYDWDLTLTELFTERFLDTVTAWCRDNGVLSRIQAYGRGYFHVDSNLGVDIPECETWYGNIMENEKMLAPSTSKGGATMSNKFVSSGANLSGKKIVSCEEITNTRFVFNETMEKIKVIGDISNLSGVSHSIFHGYNYSPPEAPFPGWVRYGSYWSEKSPLWRFYPLWTEYKGRLSTVFMNAEMQCDIAIMHPIIDLWTYHGTQRDPWPVTTYPHYANTLWEAVHQNGSGADYLSEAILQSSKFRNGRINYGGRSYSTLIMMEVETVSPGTLEAIEKYAKAGGKIFFVGKDPSKSPGLKGIGAAGDKVKSQTACLKKKYPDNVISVIAPAEGESLVEWYGELQRKYGLTPYISIAEPVRYVNQNHYRTGGLDIFFFSNYSPQKDYRLDAEIMSDMTGRRAWVWNPETGERSILPDDGNRISLTIERSGSKLIVIDRGVTGAQPYTEPALLSPVKEEPVWRMTFNHYDGRVTVRNIKELGNVVAMDGLHDFSGEIVCEAVLNAVGETFRYMELDAANCVSELYVNGAKIGVRWYGRHLYDVSGALHEGTNDIKVVLTTNLANYTLSLDNPITNYWNQRRSWRESPVGMTGGLYLYKD